MGWREERHSCVGLFVGAQRYILRNDKPKKVGARNTVKTCEILSSAQDIPFELAVAFHGHFESSALLEVSIDSNCKKLNLLQFFLFCNKLFWFNQVKSWNKEINNVNFKLSTIK